MTDDSIYPTLPPGPFDKWALFLDMDGTLIEIAPTPEAVIVPEGLAQTLGLLSARLNGALAIVSGRSIQQIDDLLKPLLFPAAGRHGAEIRLAPGSLLRVPPVIDLSPTVARLEGFAQSRPGILIEDKGFTIAAHYRLAPAYEQALREEMVDVQHALGPGWQVMPGKMVFELKPKSFDKGSGVREIMAHPPFAGRMPVVVGDDVTDEYGFAAAVGLGGHGIRIGREPAGEARWAIPDPATLRQLLADIAEGKAGSA